MKTKVDRLLAHGYLITMDERRAIFADGTIAIHEGRIAAVGKHADVAARYEAEETTELRGAIVHPGLVDAHVHVGWHLTRSWVPDDYDAKRVYTTFEHPYIEGVGPEEEYYGTLLACMEMLLNGTTCFGDTGSAFYIDDVMEAAALTGIRGCTGSLIIDQGSGERPARLAMSLDECLRKLDDQLGAYPQTGESPVWCHVGNIGLGEVSDELLIESKKLADDRRAMLHMHLSHEAEEVAAYTARTGVRPVEHLQRLGVLGPNVALVHMIHLSRGEADIVRDTGTHVVFCPGASVRFGLGASRFGRFPEMLSAGVGVALGTDAGNWSDALDMFRMMYLSSVLFRESRQEVPAISSMQSLEMATRHGAAALGMEREIGSLEPGKRADLVVHARRSPESFPVFDPITNLLYSSQSKSVDTVYIDGKPVVEAGRLTRVDSERLLLQINAAAAAFSQRIGFVPERVRTVIR